MLGGECKRRVGGRGSVRRGFIFCIVVIEEDFFGEGVFEKGIEGGKE